MTERPAAAPDIEGPASETRRLRRRTADRVIGGVAGGIADYLNVDPLLVRASFVGLMIFGGAGLVLYVVAWLLIPSERDASIVQDWFAWLATRLGRRVAVVGLALVGLGVFWVSSEAQPCMMDLETGQSFGSCGGGFRWLGGFEPVDLRNAALLAVVVIVIGFVVLRWREVSDRRSTIATGSSGSPPAAGAGAVAPGPVDHWVAHQPVRPPAIPRPGSPLGWYMLGATSVSIGALAAIGNAPGLRVGPGQYFGAALAVLGLGLVVGAWWGRARPLILLGILTLPMGLTASFLNVPLDGGLGEQMFHPTTVGELHPEYRLTGGEVYLDLTDVTSTEPITLGASVGVGRVVVLVPDEARLIIDARVAGGRLSLLGGRQVGTSLADRIERSAGTGPLLVLTLETGLGEVVVETIQDGD
jgi:phage shock protein PspC (stress-responsive transcriptional regulator)